MAKPIKAKLKLQIPAGQATPAPPIGPALGQHGINIGQFVKDFNEISKTMMGNVIPVEITIYEDRSFSLKLKTPVTSALIKKAIGIEKGSPTPNTVKVGKISMADVKKIAEIKLPDLNTNDIDAAVKIVAGTARNMGVEVEG